METLATEAVLQSDGVSPSSIRWEAMPASSMIGALRNHAVSAIVATQPYILQAESELGAVELLDACSGVTASLPLSGYFATAGVAQPGRDRAAQLPRRAQCGDGRLGPARHRALGAAHPARDVLADRRSRHGRAVPDVPEHRAGAAGG